MHMKGVENSPREEATAALSGSRLSRTTLLAPHQRMVEEVQEAIFRFGLHLLLF
jgi:formylmethanofuran dehydrogenase subunit E-like metal-binding protein